MEEYKSNYDISTYSGPVGSMMKVQNRLGFEKDGRSFGNFLVIKKAPLKGLFYHYLLFILLLHIQHQLHFHLNFRLCILLLATL